jgi:iron complex transport system ATP-binding protein
VLTERTQTGGISVYDLVSLGRYPHTGFFGTLREEDHTAIRQALDTVGIADKAQRHVSELSDGERQKAFIAKVLAQECPIILLDEPTAFLDVTSRLETMITLRRLAHREGKAILLSTHDLDTALQLADRLWLQPAWHDTEKEKPEIVPSMICGTPDTLVESGALERFFGTATLRFDPDTRRLVPVSRKK